MKERGDIDWKLFELFENDLSPEEEAALLAEIEGSEEMASDWDFMQQTRLVAPEVSYSKKDSLIKKETTLVAFTGLNWWKYAAAIVLVIASYPVWKSFVQQDGVEGMATSVEELLKPNQPESIAGGTTSPQGDQAVAEIATTKEEVVDANGALSPTNLGKTTAGNAVESGAGANNPAQRKPELTLPAPIQLVAVTGKSSVVLGQTSELPALSSGTMDYYNLYRVGEEGESDSYKGIRPVINNTLAFVSSPFRNSKVRFKPVEDSKTAFRIEYTSNQYVASAMVSLKPIKE